MDCRILRQVTLKSDGHLGCDDSVGYGIDLGRVAPGGGWRLRDVLNGPVYSHVREAFRDGRVPWPGTCEGCDLLADGRAAEDTLDRHIDLLVEPTLACTLGCACCLRKSILRKGRTEDAMDPEVLRQFVGACVREGIAVGEVRYIGWGEPLMHPDFARLFGIVKDAMPEARQMVTTAANVDFGSTVGQLPLDRLVVSVDGARNDSYVSYRRGGDLPTALQFMRDCRRIGDPDVFLEWKYILFEHNDSDEEIEEAQRLADEIGVDSLLFVLTNSKWNSQRYTTENVNDIPLISPLAGVSAAAAMNTAVATGVLAQPSGGPDTALRGHVDRCWISQTSILWVEGWALDAGGVLPDHLELRVDGKACATVRPTLPRADVVKVHPDAASSRCGFLFRVPVASDRPPGLVEVVVAGSGGAAVFGGAVNWQFAELGSKRRKDLPFAAFTGDQDQSGCET